MFIVDRIWRSFVFCGWRVHFEGSMVALFAWLREWEDQEHSTERCWQTGRSREQTRLLLVAGHRFPGQGFGYFSWLLQSPIVFELQLRRGLREADRVGYGVVWTVSAPSTSCISKKQTCPFVQHLHLASTYTKLENIVVTYFLQYSLFLCEFPLISHRLKRQSPEPHRARLSLTQTQAANRVRQCPVYLHFPNFVPKTFGSVLFKLNRSFHPATRHKIIHQRTLKQRMRCIARY